MDETLRIDRCLAVVLQAEGGFSDNSKDKGGPTKLGVTMPALQAFLGRPVTTDEIRALTPAAVAPLYHKDYWRAAACDRLPPGLDLMAFDSAVNMGPGAARKQLQMACNVTVDGAIGPRTLAAVAAHEAGDLVRVISALRADRYRSLDGFVTFGRGWLNRLEAVTAQAMDWAKGD